MEQLPELLAQLLGLLNSAFVVQSDGIIFYRRRNQWFDKDCKYVKSYYSYRECRKYQDPRLLRNLFQLKWDFRCLYRCKKSETIRKTWMWAWETDNTKEFWKLVSPSIDLRNVVPFCIPAQTWQCHFIKLSNVPMSTKVLGKGWWGKPRVLI